MISPGHLKSMISSSNNISSHSKSDFLLAWSLPLLALMAGGLLLLVVAFLFRESWPALQRIGLSRFVSDPDWYPTDHSYRLTSMVWGTILATAGAVLLASPLGMHVLSRFLNTRLLRNKTQIPRH